MMFSYYISFVKYYFFVETVFWRLRGCACVRPLCRSYGTERAQIFTGRGRGVGLHDGILATVESARMCARAPVKAWPVMWRRWCRHGDERCGGPMGPRALKFSLDIAEAWLHTMASLKGSSSVPNGPAARSENWQNGPFFTTFAGARAHMRADSTVARMPPCRATPRRCPVKI